jgi:hypothetical protein
MSTYKFPSRQHQTSCQQTLLRIRVRFGYQVLDEEGIIMDKSRDGCQGMVIDRRRKLTCKLSLYTGKDDGYRLHPHLISRSRGEERSCGMELTLSAIQPYEVKKTLVIARTNRERIFTHRNHRDREGPIDKCLRGEMVGLNGHRHGRGERKHVPIPIWSIVLSRGVRESTSFSSASSLGS